MSAIPSLTKKLQNLLIDLTGNDPIQQVEPALFGEWGENVSMLIEVHKMHGPEGVIKIWNTWCIDQPELENIHRFCKDYTLADLAAVIPETEWLWQNWLPKGYVTLLVGKSGGGKSWLALQLAKSILSGTSWPDGSPVSQTGPIVWVDTEASQALLAERAQRMELPLSKIFVPVVDSDDLLADMRLDSLEGWAEFSRLIKTHHPQLAVVDSLSGAYSGDENSTDMRKFLRELAALARNEQIAILVTHHLRKSTPMALDGEITLDSIRGSSTIVQFARLVLGIDRPDATYSPDTVRMKVIKSNLSTMPEPLGYRITENGLIFTDVPEAPRTETQMDKASALLLELLEDGPVRSTEIYDEAEELGISKPTVRRAKKHLAIDREKRTDGWYWVLPSEAQEEEVISF